MLSILRSMSVSRLPCNNVALKTQHTHGLLKVLVGRSPIARLHFSSVPRLLGRKPPHGHLDSMDVSYNDSRSEVQSESGFDFLEDLVKSRASETREQGSLDASLRVYLDAKRRLDAAQEYLYQELTTPTEPARVEDDTVNETYEEFVKRLPWPKTSSGLRDAFHDDIGSKVVAARRRQAF